MKDKSWIIILIMGIALTISIAYSIFVSKIAGKSKESTVTTTSIIEMTATTATIKNTLTGNGEIEYRSKEQNKVIDSENQQNNEEQVENMAEGDEDIVEDETKIYQITLTIEDKDLEKAKVDQDVEISIKNSNGESLNYIGKVTKINKDTNNKSTINIEVLNPDDKIKENTIATCTVIVEKAEDVVALPIEAIQKNDQNGEYVDAVQIDGTTKQINIKTGLSDDYYVEITSGLNVGDRVQIVKSSTTVVNEKENDTASKN